MRRLVWIIALGLLSNVTSLAVAQGNRTEELRQQIRKLERQLDEQEHTGKQYSRVTQIGGPRSAERRDDLVVRLYDLSDLFASAPTYPAERLNGLRNEQAPLFPVSAASQTGGASGGMGGMGGMGGGMGGGFFNTPDREPRLPTPEQRVLLQKTGDAKVASSWASLDDLIAAITSTIDPASWNEVGGSGSIARLGTALLISTTRANHEQIDSLLQLFRQRWGTLRTISVRAWWLWLNDDRAEQLLRGKQVPAGDLTSAFGTVDADEWRALLAEAEGAEAPEQKGYRASITCYNGQTVSTQSARQRLAVTGSKLMKSDAAPNVLGYAASTTLIQEGAALQVTPMSNVSGNIVVIDIHSQVSHLLRDLNKSRRHVAGNGNAASEPTAIVAAIDNPLLAIEQLATTLRVPANEVMLVGGMSSSSAPTADHPHLFLFIEVSVQELRDDREQRPEMKVPQPSGKNTAREEGERSEGKQDQPQPDKED